MSLAVCPACGAEHAASALACPNCRVLIHAERLAELNQRANAARAVSNVGGEREAWREAVTLLPEGTKQRGVVERRLFELEGSASEKPIPEAPPSGISKAGGILGVVGLLAWKFKTLILLAFGKLKFLALGLSKMSTVLSFLASFGVYWTLWGWKYALGFLVAMYIHEMGHVAALRRYGIPASAPMFVPGLGAFVRMNQHPSTTGEDARIGLAGPEWGFGAAVAAYLAYAVTGEGIFAAIGHSAAFLNLFNLIPVWQLDGSRGFAALTRGQRAVVAATFLVCWFLTREGLLGLISLVACIRVFYGSLPVKPDAGVLGRFVWLIAAFSLMLLVGVPSRT